MTSAGLVPLSTSKLFVWSHVLVASIVDVLSTDGGMGSVHPGRNER